MNIDGYEFGKIRIDGKSYTSDVIIYGDKIDGSWRREEGHMLAVNDILNIVSSKPDILIIGTGADGCMIVPEGVKKEIGSKGIKLMVKKTAEACEEYNKLKSSASVIAALHLTC